MAAKIRFLTREQLPPRWARITPFVAQKLWERICSDFGDTDETPIVAYAADDSSYTVVIGGRPAFVRIGLRKMAEIGLFEMSGSADERLLRAWRALVCEELVHFHDLLMGKSMEISPDESDAVGHYCRESEYRALKTVVEYTGLRGALLEKVEAARADMS